MSDAPTTLPSLRDAAPSHAREAFRMTAPKAALWFQPGGRDLLVTFDNLATVEEAYPRPAWLAARGGQMGHAVLGVQTFAKDWYRNPDAAPLIRGLVAAGFFAQFDRVVFIGASMGAFAAINLAGLVPGAKVIALSPQSTMSKTIAPFERRFGWAVARSDWTTPAGLDAAKAVAALPAMVVLYDSRIPEDLAHARRLAGPNVQLARIDHCTHEAVRVVMKCGALAPLIDDVLRSGRAGPAFWRAMHNRRTVRKWARAFMQRVSADGHPARIRAVARVLLAQDDYLFAHQALKTLDPASGADEQH